MRRKHRVLVVCAIGLLLALASRAALAGGLDLVVKLDRAAAPELAGTPIGNYRQATRVFGQPSRVRLKHAAVATCRADWSTLGLEIDFSTSRSPSCASRNLGSWIEIRTSVTRWHTQAGLHVGATESRLRALYPQARRLDFLGRGRLWELETGGLYCDGGPTLALGGQVRAGRVAAFLVVHVPACG